MAEKRPQTRENHVRFDPKYHYVLVPLILAAIGLGIDLVVRRRDMLSATLLVLAAGGLLMAFVTRVYALKVQDRVIRLEERLRLMSVLPPLLYHRIPELTEKQLVAMRFASDKELLALTAKVMEQNMDPKQIKAEIAEWRPDYFRV